MLSQHTPPGVYTSHVMDQVNTVLFTMSPAHVMGKKHHNHNGDDKIAPTKLVLTWVSHSIFI